MHLSIDYTPNVFFGSYLRKDLVRCLVYDVCYAPALEEVSGRTDEAVGVARSDPKTLLLSGYFAFKNGV